MDAFFLGPQVTQDESVKDLARRAAQRSEQKRTKKKKRLLQESNRAGRTWEEETARHPQLMLEMRRMIAVSAHTGKEDSMLLSTARYSAWTSKLSISYNVERNF